MDKEQIEKVKQLLTDWNPLGEKAKQINDLRNYEIEAIDILYYLDKKTSVNQINKIMTQVLSEAYDLEIDLDVSMKYAERIRKVLIN